jgi:hypothetical protein
LDGGLLHRSEVLYLWCNCGKQKINRISIYKEIYLITLTRGGSKGPAPHSWCINENMEKVREKRLRKEEK